MKRYFLIIFFTIVCSWAIAVQVPDPKYSMVKGESYVQSKNYYLLTLLQKLPEVNKLISNDAELSKIAMSKREHLLSSLKNCNFM
jgi:hypothetical protein